MTRRSRSRWIAIVVVGAILLGSLGTGATGAAVSNTVDDASAEIDGLSESTTAAQSEQTLSASDVDTSCPAPGDDDTDDADADDETDDADTGDGTDDGDDSTSDEDAVDYAAIEQYVHDAINEERVAHGVDELEFDTELRDIARDHSEDMGENGYFAHEDPNGNNFVDRYEAADYDCSVNGYIGGENLAQTWYDTPVATDDRGTVHYETEQELGNGVVEQWMNSPDHQATVLADHWENQGIGVYVTDDGKVFVTQNFC